MGANVFQRSAMVAALAACFPGLVYGAVARVEFAIGEVSAVSEDGRSRPLAKGSEVNVRETVRVEDGRAQLRFTDGAFMSLQPRTEFVVSEYRFSGSEDGKEGVVMRLLKGGMRTITGMIGRTNKENYRLVTDVATIGIRGTEYSVRYTNSIEVFCAGGAIFVQNDAGTLVLNGGEGARVLNIQTPPTRTQEPPVLAPQAASGAGKQQEAGESLASPTNPLQDASRHVTEEKILARSPAVAALAGTLLGNWAATITTTSEVQAWIGQQFTLDAAGKAIAFGNTFEGPLEVGTASAVSDGNDGVLAWGRWLSGKTGGSHTYFANKTLNSTEVLHYVVGPLATNMPTSGTATYRMIGQTAASWTGNISSARVDSSSIAVDFGVNTASMQFTMTVNGQPYSVASLPLQRYTDWMYEGGTRSASGAMFYGFGALTGGTSAYVAASGMFAGEGAARAGVVYDARMIDLQGAVRGAVAYTKN